MQKLNKSYFLVPVIPPQNVTAVSKTSTSIFITWDAVSSNQLHGNILGYKVNWILTGKHGGVETKEFSVAMANLTGLRRGRRFNLIVFAFNECGDGPASDIIIVKTDKESKWYWIKWKTFAVSLLGYRNKGASLSERDML